MQRTDQKPVKPRKVVEKVQVEHLSSGTIFQSTGCMHCSVYSNIQDTVHNIHTMYMHIYMHDVYAYHT